MISSTNSFPTRRSSDLAALIARSTHPSDNRGVPPNAGSNHSAWRAPAQPEEYRHRNTQEHVYGHHRHWGDRKSTRLNSSHVRISYAVFCLKNTNDTTSH